MIHTEFYRTREDGVNLYRTYSDSNVLIHGGYPEGDYEESIDPEGTNRTFVETDIPISYQVEFTPDEAYEAVPVLLGYQ